MLDGEIRVEVLDAEGSPLERLSGEDMGVYKGNTHCRLKAYDFGVEWPRRSIHELGGQAIRLEFCLKGALTSPAPSRL